MLAYLARRLLVMIPTLVAISAIVFFIIQLPPGDYLSTMVEELLAQGEKPDGDRIRMLREQFGLDRTPIEQYLHWAGGASGRRSRLVLRIQPAGLAGRR